MTVLHTPPVLTPGSLCNPRKGWCSTHSHTHRTVLITVFCSLITSPWPLDRHRPDLLISDHMTLQLSVSQWR